MTVTCFRCGYKYTPAPGEPPECPLCHDRWAWWDLIFPALPTGEGEEEVAQAWGEWLGMLPLPAFLEISHEDGLRVRLAVPPGTVDRTTAEAWSALARRRMRLEQVAQPPEPLPHGWALYTPERLPSFALQTADALPALLPHLQNGRRLRIWLIGREDRLQAFLRRMLSYQYGVDSGVSDRTPNLWGLRLSLSRFLLFLGGGVAALGGGFLALHNFTWGMPLLAGGGMVFTGGVLGMLDFIRWRSIPKDVVEQAVQGPLFAAAFSLHEPRRGEAPELRIWGGETRWLPFDRPSPWPDIRRMGRPVGGANLAALIRPPARSEAAAGFAEDAYQDIPAPPPSRALTHAPLLLGTAVATGEPVGIDPDAHALIVGGSRSGKSSAVYGLLKNLAAQGEDAPGLFLVDPHLSLADAFLDAVAQLPPDERAKAVERLIVVDVTRPEVVPMNLLTLPDYSWAGGALVELGRRIWEDYWGPRMQAALLGLFRLGHAWNTHRVDAKLGLIHTVFMAYNRDFRDVAMQYLRPDERVGTLALNALLGQMEGAGNKSWLTEVISPVISKLMAMEMSPWLFDALHRDRFVDMARWINNRYWIVLRLSTGDMGRPAARIAAAVLYNVFEAVYRKTVTANDPKPFYIVVDEAQEVAAGMKLENPLAEGGKFGLRVFLLTQSLTMLRQIEGFESVVQALLANTSTQMFFSPDPDDTEIIEKTLRAGLRYGKLTFDLPSLQCWLRARLGGRWQPPTLIRVKPLATANRERVQRLIDEAIEAHPDDFAPLEERGQNIVDALIQLLPPSQQAALGLALGEDNEAVTRVVEAARAAAEEDDNRLGL